jgi:hypothetical protein
MVVYVIFHVVVVFAYVGDWHGVAGIDLDAEYWRAGKLRRRGSGLR